MNPILHVSCCYYTGTTADNLRCTTADNLQWKKRKKNWSYAVGSGVALERERGRDEQRGDGPMVRWSVAHRSVASHRMHGRGVGWPGRPATSCRQTRSTHRPQPVGVGNGSASDVLDYIGCVPCHATPCRNADAAIGPVLSLPSPQLHKKTKKKFKMRWNVGCI